MQTSVEKVSAIGRKLSVVVPADTVETAVQARLKQLSKRVKVQGFRPGKVPMKIVDQQYRGTATNEVLGDIIQTSLQEALAKEEIVPAVQPDILPEPLEKGADFTYVASFDVYPEFDKLDIHVHVPEGATPKDGPSAGVTMASALVSLGRGKQLKKGTAMTGELTLTGRVLAVGGIREKLIAAKRSGVKHVILPAANQGDYEILPAYIKAGVTVNFAEKFTDVIDLIF